MKVMGRDDGRVIFLFEEDEKSLAIRILQSFDGKTPEAKKEIEAAIVEVIMAGHPKTVN